MWCGACVTDLPHLLHAIRLDLPVGEARDAVTSRLLIACHSLRGRESYVLFASTSTQLVIAVSNQRAFSLVLRLLGLSLYLRHR